ncbi:uncharacterized protein [Tiliqua scincoides]|uniref:uncharacterized protein isoform X2 n=1 Tax=Tiliqua scincoides TaxID=71010 RepID=UPI00346375CC
MGGGKLPRKVGTRRKESARPRPRSSSTPGQGGSSGGCIPSSPRFRVLPGRSSDGAPPANGGRLGGVLLGRGAWRRSSCSPIPALLGVSPIDQDGDGSEQICQGGGCVSPCGRPCALGTSLPACLPAGFRRRVVAVAPACAATCRRSSRARTGLAPPPRALPGVRPRQEVLLLGPDRDPAVATERISRRRLLAPQRLCAGFAAFSRTNTACRTLVQWKSVLAAGKELGVEASGRSLV